jgi:hypothetical protein
LYLFPNIWHFDAGAYRINIPPNSPANLILFSIPDAGTEYRLASNNEKWQFNPAF